MSNRVKNKWKDHLERNRPSGLDLALADSIHYVNAAHWDTLTAGTSLFLSRPYLEVLEEASPENLVPRYALVYRGREAVCAVAAQSVLIQAARLGKAALEMLEERVLVCGNLLSWGPHGVAFAPREDRSLLWPAVAEALYRIRRADRLLGETNLLMVKDLPKDHLEGIGALERFSYRPLETEPDMVLSLDPAWRSHGDYMAALKSKYRKAVATTIESVAEAGFTIERLDDVERHASALHALYLDVHRRQKIRLATLPAEFLPALATRLGARMRCIVARRGDEIAGFVTTLRDGETAVGYYMGYDRRALDEAPIYLRLLQAVVEDAIEQGASRVSLGRTALDPKARLGAKPEALRVWIRHRVPVFNLFLRGLLHAVPREEPPERRPFAGLASRLTLLTVGRAPRRRAR